MGIARFGRCLPLGCVLLFGCSNLPDIDGDTCGNGIVESHEDCDSKDPSCVPRGEPGECRFDCSMVDGARRECPKNYQCGHADNICRQATGTFEPLGTAGN